MQARYESGQADHSPPLRLRAQIDFGRDLERQLDVYTDCRLSFPNIDEARSVAVLVHPYLLRLSHPSDSSPALPQVKVNLVRAAIALTLKALGFVNGRHSARTAAFVKSAFAFIAITIPGIDNPFARMVRPPFTSRVPGVWKSPRLLCRRSFARRASLLSATAQ